MNTSQLRVALQVVNVSAFLRVIRERESGQDDLAYTVINGGQHFQVPPWQHPWPSGTPTTQGGRAAGAYQFLPSTWKRLADQYDFPDFSPEYQDLGAVALIAGRGALDDIVDGRFEQAVAKCRPEWTSLPGAAESSSSWTIAKARECYVGYGGTFATASAPVIPATPVSKPAGTAKEAARPVAPSGGTCLLYTSDAADE